jgi:aminoglycoside phosphotransferase (APT) family kinase protein
MSCVWEDRRVLVHGDATPANFLFGAGLWVIALDMERLKVSHRVFGLDTGSSEFGSLSA